MENVKLVVKRTRCYHSEP